MNAALLRGDGGKPVTLGAKIGSGGEGTVYVLSATSVGKIYTVAPPRDRIEKLETLIRARDERLTSIAAWPSQLLRGADGTVAGFAMERIDARVPISTVTNPGSRKARFPQASWAWLIHVARNVAAVVETVHRSGVVIGDINESNFLVGTDASVRAIDVDSFQIASGSRTFTSDVGIPVYQAPELQGRSFIGLRRTPDHDRFGLAVLIFQLIFMGRHPWAGIWNGPEMAFETGEIVASLPYAFGLEAPRVHFFPPAKTVRLDWLPHDTATLFDRAFARGATTRPSGEAWALALDAFERDLVACNRAPIHRYIKTRSDCPWCALERDGVTFFLSGRAGEGTAAAVYLDIAAIERRIAEIPPLVAARFPVDLAPAHVDGVPLGAPAVARRRFWLAGLAASVLAGAVVVPEALHAVWISSFSALDAAAVLATATAFTSASRARRRTLRAADARYNELRERWHTLANVDALVRRKAQLEQYLDEYRGLPARYANERRHLEMSKPAQQMRAHLAAYLLADAKIPGIGRKRKATLRMFGIETALDVEEQLPNTALPEFGATRRATLALWLHHLKLQFQYDPALPVDPALLADVQARENAERSSLERELRGGPQALRADAERLARVLEGLRPDVAAAARDVAQARADVRLLRRI